MSRHPAPGDLRPDPPQRGSTLWTVLGAALGLVLLYAAARRVDAPALLGILRGARPEWVLLVPACTVGFVAIKVARWRMLLGFAPRVRFSDLHAATWSGLAVNFLLAHAGEFLRASAVARRNTIPTGAVLATIVVERVLDFLALLIVLAATFYLAPSLPPFVETALLMTGVIATMGIAAVYLLLHTPQWLTGLASRAGRPLPEAARRWLVKQFTLSRDGFVAIRNVRRMILAVALSVLQWALLLVAIGASVRAIGEPASVAAVVATMVLIIVGLMLPNSPMQIGTTQVAFTIGLATGGIAATAAVAASLIYTLFVILVIMIVGGVYLIHVRRIDETGNRVAAR